MGKTTQTPEREKITSKKRTIKKQLTTGFTIGRKRQLTPQDITDLEKEYARLEALVPSGRILGRILSTAQARDAHTTAQANRVIETVREVAGRETSNYGCDLYVMSNPRIPNELKVGRSKNAEMCFVGSTKLPNENRSPLLWIGTLGKTRSLGAARQAITNWYRMV